MHKFGAALAAGALLLVSACGGDQDDGRPSAGEISKALQKGTSGTDLGLSEDLSDDAADCIADVLVSSEVSDQALQSIIEGDKSYTLSEKDEAALTPTVPELTKCLEDVVPEGTPSS